MSHNQSTILQEKGVVMRLPHVSDILGSFGLGRTNSQNQAHFVKRDSDHVTLPEQPNFGPKQVKSLDQLVEGQKYQLQGNSKNPIEVTLIRGPYLNVLGKNVVQVKEELSGQLHEISICDYGIIPYEGGYWNVRYCMLHT